MASGGSKKNPHPWLCPSGPGRDWSYITQTGRLSGGTKKLNTDQMNEAKYPVADAAEAGVIRINLAE